MISKYLIVIATVFFYSTAIFAKAPEVFTHTVDTVSPSKNFSAVTDALQQVKLLRGGFIQTKSIAILRHPLVSDGEFLLVSDRGLYWQIDNPVKIRFLMNSQGIHPLDNSRQSPPPAISQSLGPIFMAMVSGDVKTLAENFSLYFLGSADKWSIGLKPRSETFIDKAIEYIVLNGGQHIEDINIQESNGDTTQLQLKSLQTMPNTLTDDEEGYFAAK